MKIRMRKNSYLKKGRGIGMPLQYDGVYDVPEAKAKALIQSGHAVLHVDGSVTKNPKVKVAPAVKVPSPVSVKEDDEDKKEVKVSAPKKSKVNKSFGSTSDGEEGDG